MAPKMQVMYDHRELNRDIVHVNEIETHTTHAPSEIESVLAPDNVLSLYMSLYITVVLAWLGRPIYVLHWPASINPNSMQLMLMYAP